MVPFDLECIVSVEISVCSNHKITTESMLCLVFMQICHPDHSITVS